MTITGTTVLTRVLTDLPQNYTYDGSLVFTSDSGEVFKPTRFWTDEATIPRIFWSIPGFGPDDWVEAAVLHDWMYAQHHNDPNCTFTQKQADDLLYEAILACGYSRFVAYVSWIAVRAAGWTYWRNRKLR